MEKIKIKRDINGIPEISAYNERDLYFGLGYCHAMDRGLQILIMRILGQGRACEILDDNDELFEIDKFFRKMNFKKALQEQLDFLNKDDLLILESYSEGINSYLKKSIPWEFKLLGLKFENWTPKDSILISRMIGYLTLAQSQAEIESFIIQLIKNEISKELLEELFPRQLEGLDIDLIKKLKQYEPLVPESIKWKNIIPKFISSNNWVISGNKTISGKPIMANDPHLETNRLPNVWYEIKLKCAAPSINAAGASMPGLPGLLIGRNENIAWGATYSFMDSVDSWIEDCQDFKYLENGNYIDFNQRKEIIKRKKNKDEEITFYENSRGYISGVPKEKGYYLSTKWSSLESGSKSVSSIISILKAKDAKSGSEIMGEIETSWNWVFADKEGNITYQMSGLLPIRKKDISGLIPIYGWEKENSWQGFYNYKDLPRSINPLEGFFITANNDLNKYGNENPINICMEDYRYQRIKELLEEKEKLNTEDMMRIQSDLYSIQAKKYLERLIPLLPNNYKADILRKWDLKYSIDSKGAYLFELFYKNLLEEVFGSIFGEKVFNFVFNETGVFIDFYGNFDVILLSEKSKWFNGKTRDEIYKKSIEKSFNEEIKTWGEKNKLNFTNIFFGGKLPALLGFDKNNISIPGSRATVFQGQIYNSAGRKSSFIPSYRIITDLSENNIYTNIAGGPSDRRFSKWYISDLNNWINLKYKKISID